MSTNCDTKFKCLLCRGEAESEGFLRAKESPTNIDERYVSGTGKLGFSFVRITALLVSSNRLWMGTGNGVIISVPLTSLKTSKSAEEQIAAAVTPSGGGHSGGDGDQVKVYADSHTDKLTVETFIPYCSMSQAQLSFHGHRDAVKFFVSVPGKLQ